MKYSSVIINPKVRSEVAVKVTQLPADGTFQVTISKLGNNRSLNQNNLYWQWLGMIAEYTGNSVDILHLYLKKKFLGVKYIDIFGSCVETISDSHNLSISDFANYMTQVQAFAATELGIELPTA